MLDYKRIVDIINDLGYKTYTFNTAIYANYIQGCADWYKGEVPGLHKRKKFNGKYHVTETKSALHMCKRACEDMASLVANQNMIINVDSNLENDFLLGTDDMEGILGDNNFFSEFSKLYEMTCALGTGAIEIVIEDMLKVGDKIAVSNNSRIRLRRYDAMHIVPLSWDSLGNILEVAFIDKYSIKDEDFLELRLHILDEKKQYKIINKKCKVSKQSNSNTIADVVYVSNDDVIDELSTKSNVPFFTVIKTGIMNSYEPNSPMGASIVQDCSDTLRAVDEAFNTLSQEFERSMKKVFYHASMLDRDENNEPIIPDEANRGVFYITGDSYSDGKDVKDPIKEHNPTIRTKELTEGLDLALSLLSFQVGLGAGYWKFTSSGVQKTATEVISANSSLYRNICKMQLAIEKNIYEVCRGILYVSNLIFGTSFDVNCKMSIEWDQSIIENKTEDKLFDLELVKNNLMTVKEFRCKWLKELEENSGETSPDTLTE